MIRPFFESTMLESVYKIKEGTSTSYYWQSGSRILPNRLSISFGAELSWARREGRMLIENVVGEVKGRFTKAEQSPLKQNPPFGIHSKIFRPDHFPLVDGYAIIGITDKQGKITRNSEEGFVAFKKVEAGTFRIFFCAGITNPSEKEEALSFVNQKIKGMA